ncbi:MAG: hypothetical protein ACRERV_12500 [Methylococcales bacterium]
MRHPGWFFFDWLVAKTSNITLHSGAFALIATLTGCAGLTGCNSQETPELVENGYPTQARVEYVLECMEKNGGQNYDTLYSCMCSIDKIATQLPYNDFAEAQTFSHYRELPGEAGGLFRDPPRAKELGNKLEEAEVFAKQNCFIKHSKASGS